MSQLTHPIDNARVDGERDATTRTLGDGVTRIEKPPGRGIGATEAPRRLGRGDSRRDAGAETLLVASDHAVRHGVVAQDRRNQLGGGAGGVTDAYLGIQPAIGRHQPVGGRGGRPSDERIEKAAKAARPSDRHGKPVHAVAGQVTIHPARLHRPPFKTGRAEKLHGPDGID
jgi:hypothetical protein